MEVTEVAKVRFFRTRIIEEQEEIGMKEEHFSFVSNDNSTKIHGVRWIPQGEIKAVLQIVHGMSEHIERYGDLAEYLCEQGVLVVGHDHLGHGGSAASEADYGYFAKENGSQILIRDIHKVCQMTKGEYYGVPYILLGHSMGSFLTRQFLGMYGEELSGAVISGTGYMPAGMLKAAMVLSKIESRIFGERYRSRLLHLMSFGNYNRAFRPNRTEFDWLCRDKQIVDAYIGDVRCGFPFTVNGYYNLFLTMYQIVRKEYLERMPKELPVLFIAGEKDPVGDCGKGVHTVVELFQKQGMKDLECRIYPEDRHEVFNELDKDVVFRDVAAWMQKHDFI